MREVVIEQPCKSVLNRVAGSSMPFRWSINPYRGCEHACTYCYARKYHEYLEMDPGREFETRIIAKVNAPEVLRQELGRRSWQHEPVAIGTAVDPYQPAEGRYRITRRILEALLDFKTPCSLITKNTMILRDLDVLQALAAGPGCQVHFSITTLDARLVREIEPDTPPPSRRLEVLQALVRGGIPAGVILAPVLPALTDHPDSLEAVVRAAAEHSACFLHASVLRLEGATRAVYESFLARRFPVLLPYYRSLYRTEYAPPVYQRRIQNQVREFARAYGIGKSVPAMLHPSPVGEAGPAAVSSPQQLALFR